MKIGSIQGLSGIICLVVVLGFSMCPLFAKEIRVEYRPIAQVPADQLEGGIPKAEIGYHPMDVNSWGEGWWFVARTEDDLYIYCMLSVSNYHPTKNFCGTVDLWVQKNMTGETMNGHGEYEQSSIEGKTNQFYIRIGENLLKGTYPHYKFHVAEGELVLDMNITAVFESIMIGDSKAYFIKPGGSERYWQTAIIIPAGTMQGRLKMEGKAIPIKGVAYMDHGYSTIKIPSYSKSWQVMSIYDQNISFKVWRQELKDNYKGEDLRYLMLFYKGEKIINTSDFELKMSGYQRARGPNIEFPTLYQVNYQKGGTRLHGTIKYTDFISEIDILGRLSFIVRTAVKLFYTNPWQFRRVAEFKLTLERNGKVFHIRGKGIGEAHSY